ncbi:MAG: hypothetical protein ABR497_04275 [Kiritimatiellia bacterium]|nr:hypothetical protein [Lentisphaerota bacterium]
MMNTSDGKIETEATADTDDGDQSTPAGLRRPAATIKITVGAAPRGSGARP